MKAYRVLIKNGDPDRTKSTWGDSSFLVMATSFGNAEDKVQKHIRGGHLQSITYEGEVTRNDDVIELNTKH